jgi:hypothetical protein
MEAKLLLIPRLVNVLSGSILLFWILFLKSRSEARDPYCQRDVGLTLGNVNGDRDPSLAFQDFRKRLPLCLRASVVRCSIAVFFTQRRNKVQTFPGSGHEV